ncbi:hypothetical protein SASPL_116239 [Salvia splendens]|uniref:Uncharacterized protein n=1 Tax=Salvia splendens TaxID=180675 RepID=A0A8X8ZWP0_SALSN|nr:hypothetical protein SASPL_116239 [Salvia splendens]
MRHTFTVTNLAPPNLSVSHYFHCAAIFTSFTPYHDLIHSNKLSLSLSTCDLMLE